MRTFKKFSELNMPCTWDGSIVYGSFVELLVFAYAYKSGIDSRQEILHWIPRMPFLYICSHLIKHCAPFSCATDVRFAYVEFRALVSIQTIHLPRILVGHNHEISPLVFAF